jgi:probable rRNA maturation factor
MLFFSINATASQKKNLPPATLKKISAVLSKHLKFEKKVVEVTLAFVGTKTMQTLNHDFRGKNKPTNVLSFPQFTSAELKKHKADIMYLGDVILHLPTLRSEALSLKKPINHHLIHLVVHGVLHLLGYDHMNNTDAHTMEKHEKTILGKLGIKDPYLLIEPAKTTQQKKKR